MMIDVKIIILVLECGGHKDVLIASYFFMYFAKKFDSAIIFK